MTAFHEILFPLDIAVAASGGPERRTDIVALASGFEERNARWAHSRRRYDAGYGVKSLEALAEIVAFFEERRGRLYGFRWFDRLDSSSSAPRHAPAATDQVIGAGDGKTTTFQLVKTYGAAHAPYVRTINKPVDGSVKLAVNGTELAASNFAVDPRTGLVTLKTAPVSGAVITAGYSFHVPVRFDTDRLEINLSAFTAGDIPSIPLIEIRI